MSKMYGKVFSFHLLLSISLSSILRCNVTVPDLFPVLRICCPKTTKGRRGRDQPANANSNIYLPVVLLSSERSAFKGHFALFRVLYTPNCNNVVIEKSK